MNLSLLLVVLENDSVFR
jgi:hypothetical protein